EQWQRACRHSRPDRTGKESRLGDLPLWFCANGTTNCRRLQGDSRNWRKRALYLVSPMGVDKRKADVTTKVLGTFKQLISEGTLGPGARLPAEREMANSLRVSRGSLRQALKMLEVMGVVSQRVGDGTYLNGAGHSILAEPMEFLILLEGISFDEL